MWPIFAKVLALSRKVGTVNPSSSGTDTVFNYLKKLDDALASGGEEKAKDVLFVTSPAALDSADLSARIARLDEFSITTPMLLNDSIAAAIQGNTSHMSRLAKGDLLEEIASSPGLLSVALKSAYSSQLFEAGLFHMLYGGGVMRERTTSATGYTVYANPSSDSYLPAIYCYVYCSGNDESNGSAGVRAIMDLTNICSISLTYNGLDQVTLSSANSYVRIVVDGIVKASSQSEGVATITADVSALTGFHAVDFEMYLNIGINTTAKTARAYLNSIQLS